MWVIERLLGVFGCTIVAQEVILCSLTPIFVIFVKFLLNFAKFLIKILTMTILLHVNLFITIFLCQDDEIRCFKLLNDCVKSNIYNYVWQNVVNLPSPSLYIPHFGYPPFLGFPQTFARGTPSIFHQYHLKVRNQQRNLPPENVVTDATILT